MKKLSLIAVALFMAIALVACSAVTTDSTAAESSAPAEQSTEASAAASAAEPAAGGAIKIGVSVADQSNPFYIEILDGMESAVQGDDQLIVMDAGFDAAKQITDIEDMIQQGVSVMMIDPVDSNGIQASLNACKAAGIPVVCYNSPVDDASLVESTVATDNFMAGQLIGEALGEALEGKGKVVMLTYNVAQVCADRANGFKDALSQYPDIEIVEEQEIQPGVDTAMPVMENMLQAYPDLTGVFALNDPSAIGCAAAVDSAGKLDQIKIVGVDGSEDGIAAIKEGKMFASASQDPVEIGKQSIEVAYKVIAGETVEADIKVPSALVTAETLQAGE
ncbi:sugar ABC transporter substrate-binding protein [Christensenella tenuis]|uniref:Sugar ABC transporter substrate-binding protein n=1 Tax=Christensenella tenuis TaxID=2763033 RepID=A0ABR7EFM1_9FIRM|nr:sugar ABC transporter substrate-binding protein [Christensenella tenuis]MBC5647968.1 sugar ABC transporter substrate-binding protein [Christensenella tenuis]